MGAKMVGDISLCKTLPYLTESQVDSSSHVKRRTSVLHAPMNLGVKEYRSIVDIDLVYD